MINCYNFWFIFTNWSNMWCFSSWCSSHI